jgi:hypothetical protein
MASFGGRSGDRTVSGAPRRRTSNQTGDCEFTPDRVGEQERTGLDTAAAPRTSCHWSTADGSALFVASSRCQPGTELSIGDCGEGESSPQTALSPSECKVGRVRVTSPWQPAPAATGKGQRIDGQAGVLGQ